MYQAKKYDRLIGLSGFSEQLLRNHLTLYEGYVANVNKLAELLDAKESGTPEYSELQRRFGWEFDGMRLHEYYFENLTKNSAAPNNDADLQKAIAENFGSFEEWEKGFRAVLSMRGIGWGILYYDVTGKRLFNTWINEHDGGHLAGCIPILVVDAFEHAFMLDYGTKRAEYIDAVMKVIDWNEVENRFKMA